MTAGWSREQLIDAAGRARENAYVPYSGFDAGAAVAADDGSIVTGSLVENISLGLAMCAERVAMFATVSAGKRPVALALAAPDTAGGSTWPCGACLQVALELGGPDLEVMIADEPDSSVDVGELIPRGPHRG